MMQKWKSYFLIMHQKTENKPSKDSCDLLMKKANLEFSQYKLVKSEKCYDYLLANLYPKAAEIAKMQGGNLTLDIDEERHTGKLEYWGAFLMSTSGDTLLKNFLVSAMTMTDQFSFEVKDSLLHLEFFFELYNQVKMKDYSKEIEQLGLKNQGVKYTVVFCYPNEAIMQPL